jgi:hypothetical protein
MLAQFANKLHFVNPTKRARLAGHHQKIDGNRFLPWRVFLSVFFFFFFSEQFLCNPPSFLEGVSQNNFCLGLRSLFALLLVSSLLQCPWSKCYFVKPLGFFEKKAHT